MAAGDGSNGGVTVSELSRQLRDVLVRFEGLVRRVEDKFVTKEVFDLRVSATDKKGEELQSDINTKVSQNDFDNLTQRVKELEEGRTWLNRLVIGAIITALIGLFFALVVSVGGVPR